MRISARWLSAALTIVAVLAVALVAPFVASEEPDAAAAQGGPLLVVGFSGVTWSDVGAHTPALASLVDAGASANLVVKTTGITTCPNAGWATLHYGVRAAASDECAGFIDVDADGSIADAAGLDAAQAESAYGIPGQSLGELLGDRSLAALGPGAAIALQGGSPTYTDLEYDGGIATGAADAYRRASGADVVVMDLGRVRDDAAGSDASALAAAFSGPREIGADARASIEQLDRELADVLDHVPFDVTVMVLSLADVDTTTARLQLFSVIGPAVASGTEAQVNSTRHSGLVQLTDVPQTILSLAGEQASEDFVGSPIRLSGGKAASLTSFDDVHERALSVRPGVGPFYVLVSAAGVAFLIDAVIVLRQPGSRMGARGQMAGSTVAALPVASFLANLLPWWRLESSTLAFLALAVLIAMAIAGLAMWTSRHGVAGAGTVALVTAVTIGADAIAGSTLHASSVLGDQPQSGGRFYGLSNAPFTLFTIAMIVVTVVAMRELKTYRAAVAVPGAIIAMGLSAALIDGAPAIGADFGGPPAIVVAFIVLLFLALGRAFTGTTVVLIAAGAGGLAMLISFLDWLRPDESRTHLGNFFQDVVDGEFVAVVARKFGLLWNSVPWFAWILAALAMVGAYLWWKRGAWLGLEHPSALEFRWGFVATVALCLSALVINDSGLVIPLFGLVFGAPLAITGAQWAVAEMPARSGRAGER